VQLDLFKRALQRVGERESNVSIERASMMNPEITLHASVSLEPKCQLAERTQLSNRLFKRLSCRRLRLIRNARQRLGRGAPHGGLERSTQGTRMQPTVELQSRMQLGRLEEPGTKVSA
jgi:hypothetical protein